MELQQLTQGQRGTNLVVRLLKQVEEGNTYIRLFGDAEHQLELLSSDGDPALVIRKPGGEPVQCLVVRHGRIETMPGGIHCSQLPVHVMDAVGDVMEVFSLQPDPRDLSTDWSLQEGYPSLGM